MTDKIIMNRCKTSVLVIFGFVFFQACVGFPDRSWIQQTRQVEGNESRERVARIANQFDQIKKADQNLAIQTVAAEPSKTGQDGLFELLENNAVNSDPALKKQVIQEIQKRPEDNTADRLLSKAVSRPDLRDPAILDWLSAKKGSQAAASFLKRMESNPAELDANMVDLFVGQEYQPAHALLLKQIPKRPELVDSSLAVYFSSHKEPEAPPAFLAAIQSKNDLMELETVSGLFLSYKYAQAAPDLLKIAQADEQRVSEPLIRYFGQIAYKPAVDFIKENITRYKYIDVGIDSLAQMRDPSTNLYILALTRDNNPQLRLAAVQKVAQMSDEQIRNQARPDMQQILRNHSTEVPDIVLASVNFFVQSDFDSRSFELLKRVYNQNQSIEVRNRALLAMARMRQVDVRSMKLALENGMRPADLNLMNQKQEPKKVEKKQPKIAKKRTIKKTIPHNKTAYACRVRSKYDQKDVARMRSKMSSWFGAELSRDLRSRIDNALKSYAASDSAKAHLIQRSYQQLPGLQDISMINNNMRQGLAWPGSLSLIAWGIHKEYKSDQMRIYALASLFAIERWKAKDLLMLVREQCL